MKTRRSARGYSLVELSITIAIIGILAVVAYPSLRALIPRYRHEAAVRDITQELTLARLRAISKNRECRVQFDLDAEAFSTQLGNLASGSTSWTSLYSRVGAQSWPGVNLYLPVSETLDENAIGFTPDGSVLGAAGAAAVRLYVQGAGPERRIIAEVATGRVRTERKVNNAWVDERKLKP